MLKLSQSYKRNKILNEILLSLVELDEYGKYEEVRHYYNEYKGVNDFNLFTYGNLLIYNEDIKELYSSYKSLQKRSIEFIIGCYKRDIRYCVNCYLKHRDLYINYFLNY